MALLEDYETIAIADEATCEEIYGALLCRVMHLAVAGERILLTSNHFDLIAGTAKKKVGKSGIAKQEIVSWKR